MVYKDTFSRRDFFKYLGAGVAGAALLGNPYPVFGEEAKPVLRETRGRLENKVDEVGRKLSPSEARDVYPSLGLEVDKEHSYMLGVLDSKKNSRLVSYRAHETGSGNRMSLEPPVVAYNFGKGEFFGFKFSYEDPKGKYKDKIGLFYLMKVPGDGKKHDSYEWRFAELSVPHDKSKDISYGKSELIKSYGSLDEVKKDHKVIMGLMAKPEDRKAGKNSKK